MYSATGSIEVDGTASTCIVFPKVKFNLHRIQLIEKYSYMLNDNDFLQAHAFEWEDIFRIFWLPALQDNNLIPKDIETKLGLKAPFDIKYR